MQIANGELQLPIGRFIAFAIPCHAKPRRRFDLLDEPLRRAGRKRRPVHFGQSEPQPRHAGRSRPAVVAAGRDHRRRRVVRRRYRHADQGKRRPVSHVRHENPNSILSCLRAARENARSVREIISSEMWEQINKFYLLDPRRRHAGRRARRIRMRSSSGSAFPVSSSWASPTPR